jgi:DNA replication and repair protein RecF
MEPNTHLLVSGPPDGRRKYLDWGLFHVEPQFLDTWRRFTKILKQRNAALRSKREDVLESIDNVFIELGLKLERLRHAHTVSVKDKVLVLLKKLSPDLNLIGLEYQLGWSGNSLDEALAVCRESDFQRGATGVGPHRADVVLTCRGTVARNILSRGEQKILSAALILAQAEILADLGETPIILLDDLESEFDQEHFDRVLESALGIGGQVWVSGTRKHSFGGEHKVFHVKHGEVSEMV